MLLDQCKSVVAAKRYKKFENRYVTATGDERASVRLSNPSTIWFNTGTLCNITCENCYIESSPTNNKLVFISESEVADFLNQIPALEWPVKEIGLTGGEPFMNPEIIGIMRSSLLRGYETLVLTNAMRPMMRPLIQNGLVALNDEFPEQLTLRVSLDHYEERLHDQVRGKQAFQITLRGMDWLHNSGVKIKVAGRMMWDESEDQSRSGYAKLFEKRGYQIDPYDPSSTVLFPEIMKSDDVPEITTNCWDLLGKSPDDIMCSSSRMVIKREGASRPVVVACTLLPYDREFELGETLRESGQPVWLNHSSCAQFCVLGGASCSRR